MTIKLSAETEERLIGSIRRYFDVNMDESIGELKARLLLDYCCLLYTSDAADE